MKRFVLPILLVMSMVTIFSTTAAAHPAKQLIPNACVMQQIGVKNHGYSGGDSSFQGDVWLQGGFNGGVSCLTFQPASRINNHYFDGNEPIVHWRIALYTAANSYLTSYTWDGLGFSPQPDAQSWYFYGPIITLSCATGQIHATMDVNEALGYNEAGDDASDGDQMHMNSSNYWTC